MSDQQEHLEGIPSTPSSTTELSFAARDSPQTVPAKGKVLADEITSMPATTDDTVPTNNDAEVTTISSTYQDLGAMASNLLGYAPPLAVRDQVIKTPELCAAVLEHLDEYELCDAAIAGGPFLETIQAFADLRKQTLLDYDPDPITDPSTAFTFNHHLFWDSVPCGHRRGDGCRCCAFASMPKFGDQTSGAPLPRMEIDYFNHKATAGVAAIELCFLEPENLGSTLDSRSVFLDMRLGSPPKHIKIVVHNPETMTWVKDWQAPPSPLEWHTAEITVDPTHLRMYSIIRIAKDLFECANLIEAKTFTGEVAVLSDETGAVDDPGWKSFFRSRDLKAVVGEDGPKYRWFWKGGSGRWTGASYADAREVLANTFPAIDMPEPTKLLDPKGPASQDFA